MIFGWPSIRVTARMPTNSFFRNNRIDPLKQRIMYERSNIPVTRSVEKQSWWDVETSGGRGLDSVTLYRGFYVQIDNSPDMDVIWVGINTGYDSVTYVYAEYPKGTPLSYIKTESLIGVDQLIAAHKLTSQDRTPRLG
jgi:hypothetical protein